MSSAVVAVTGVLRTDNRKVIPEGRRLVAALAEVYRVVLALEDAELEAFNYWAKMEGITGHQEVLAGSSMPAALRGYDERISQIEFLRGRGEHVALVVDPSPERIAAMMAYGIPSLLYCDPGLMRPEWRPDYNGKVRPWNDLAAEIEKQHYLAATSE